MMDKTAGVLMFLLVILKVLGTAESTIGCSCSPSSCSCSYVLIHRVPQDLPTTITRLSCLGCSITSIRQSDFSRYRSLEDIHLGSSGLQFISSQAFYYQSNLEKLDLSHNRLKSLAIDTFTGLGILEELRLNGNDIFLIEAETFSSTPELRKLNLNDNRLTSLRAGLFTGLGNLELLSLNGNKISYIEAGAFNPMQRLMTLELDRNKFTSLTPDMFTGLGNLEELWLGLNSISDIEDGAFDQTQQLQTLILNGNHIQSLPSNVLANLRYLRYLGVYNNSIITFPFEDEDLPSLWKLSLSKNQLTTLPPTAYDVLSTISDVRIENNPWQCDCRMVGFRLKMTGTYPFENQITCSQPDNLHGLKLKDVSPEDLDMSNCENSRIVPVSGVSSPSKKAEPALTLSLPALLGAVLGSVAGAALIIGGIIFTVRQCKGNQNTPPRNQNVIFDNTRYDECAVITSEHGETEKM